MERLAHPFRSLTARVAPGRGAPADAVVRVGPERAQAFDLVRSFSFLSLVCIALVAAGAALALSRLLTAQMLYRDAVVSAEFLNSIVRAEKTWPDLVEPDPGPGPVLGSFFNHIAHLPDVVRANVFARDGTVIWSSTPGFVGHNLGPNQELEQALKGELAIESGVVGVPDKPEHVAFRAKRGVRFVETYIPIWGEDRADEEHTEMVGVVEIYREPRALFAAIDQARRLIWLGALAGGAFLYAALFGIVRRAGRVIRRQHERLVDAETMAAVGSLASTVAHNIRNPLASIRSSAELAREDGLEQAREAAADIVRETDRLDGWLRELLLHARAEQPPGSGSADLAAAVRVALDGLGPAMARRGVTLELELDERLPPVPGGQAPLAQVVDTLVTNALDAMPRGGRLRVSARTGPGRREAELRIADTGEGVPRERLRDAFRPFFTTKRGGLGLGLALVRGIVTGLGGVIELASAPGRGTIVTVRLPQAG